MRRYIGYLLLIVSLLLFINAIWGRYIVLPGYMESLDSGVVSGNHIPTEVPIFKVLRYLLWSFSFKLGALFLISGFMVLFNQKIRDIFIFVLVAFVYTCVAYIDLLFYKPLFFGIGGGIITIDMIMIFYCIYKPIEKGEIKINQHKMLLLNFGLFFLVMATYNICPFTGIKCFALSPEKMIKYNLQMTAASYANHIMIELVLGFTLLAIFFARLRRTTSK